MEKRPLWVRRWRLIFALAVGLVTGFGARAAGFLPGASTLIAWNVAALAFLIPTGWLLVREDEAQCRRRAAEEDENRFVMLSVVLGAATASFGAIVIALRESKGHNSPAWLIFLSISTIVLSWLIVQAIFCLHYAHMYFGDSDDDGSVDRGVKFEGAQPSTYRDFIYIAVCMGATFQVSDFNTTTTRFRNLITAHALVAFAFNTLVLALGVNIVASLMGQ